MILDTYFYISSIFLITNYLSKQICKKLEITKELTYSKFNDNFDFMDKLFI